MVQVDQDDPACWEHVTFRGLPTDPPASAYRPTPDATQATHGSAVDRARWAFLAQPGVLALEWVIRHGGTWHALVQRQRPDWPRLARHEARRRAAAGACALAYQVSELDVERRLAPAQELLDAAGLAAWMAEQKLIAAAERERPFGVFATAIRLRNGRVYEGLCHTDGLHAACRAGFRTTGWVEGVTTASGWFLTVLDVHAEFVRRGDERGASICTSRRRLVSISRPRSR
jgi:hypothetical protein